MACGCENTREIFPECDKTRWEVQCSSYIEDASNYYTKKQVDDLIESATTSGSCCITPEEVDEKIESAKTEIEAEIPSLSGYATEQWVLDKHYISGVDLSDYALKSEIPTVPTSNTAFTNDAGYLTEHQSLSAYSTTDEVNSAITQAVSGKQDTITAGRGISIANNTVAFNLPIYLGGKSSSISINQPTGNAQFDNKSNGFSSTAIGAGLNAQNQYEVAVGVHNVERPEVQGVAFGGSGYTLFTVGNGCGSSSNQRHNALEIRQNGDIYISDTNASGAFCDKPMIKLQDHLGGGSGTTYTAGRGISIDSGNTISLNVPISAGTGTNSIKENMSGNVASGSYSHSEGFNTFASGNFGSHAEGQGTTAKGNASHSEGGNTNAYNDFEHASGVYNLSNSATTIFGDSGNTLFSVGNGTANNARHNAFEIRQNGDIYITSGGTDIKLQDHIGGGTATTYTAGDNITISNQNVISTITKFWCGTQAQYDQITTKDPNTVYMIHS